MKIFILLLSLLVSFSVHATLVRIPGSKVVNLEDKASSLTYRIYIRTPRFYSTNPDKVYPVVYITDAPYSFRLATGATRFPINQDIANETITVGISYSIGSNAEESRQRDFTANKVNVFDTETGNAENHAAFIRDVVFPYIEKHYRADASDRTYIGYSLGGLFGAHIFFNHPEMFKNYIIGSPSVWVNNDKILSVSAVPPSSPKKVYISVGEQEADAFVNMVEGAQQLANKIHRANQGNVSLKYQIIQETDHNSSYYTMLLRGMEWVHE